MERKITITKSATLLDIKREAYKRGLIEFKPIWTDKQGQKHDITEISDDYLLNLLLFLEREEKMSQFVSEHIGDLDPLEFYD